MADTTFLTASRDPRAEDKARRDLDTIANALVTAFPSFLTIAVVGAFGRGEGAMILKHDGYAPWNDYDLILVTPDRSSWERLGQTAKNLAEQLDLPAIDIIPFTPSDLNRRVHTMPVIDAHHGHRVLRGDPEILSTLQVKDVHPDEVLILLVNRMICLLEEPPECLTGVKPDPQRHASQVSKALFAIADALLIQHGAYTTMYHNKLERLRDLSIASSTLLEALSRALSFRRKPSSDEWSDLYWFTARQLLLEHLTRLLDQPSSNDPRQIASALWKHRSESLPFRLKRFLRRGTKNRASCRAVECSEFLLLAAARSGVNMPDTALIEEAIHYMGMISRKPESDSWASVSSYVVKLWFEICHG